MGVLLVSMKVALPSNEALIQVFEARVYRNDTVYHKAALLFIIFFVVKSPTVNIENRWPG